MTHLKRLDEQNNIVLIDLNQPDIQQKFPNIDVDAAMNLLTAEWADGTRIYGLDATYAAWSTVGKRHWVAPLKWKLTRPICDMAYRFFVKHRVRIGGLLAINQCRTKSDTTHSKH